MKNNKWIYGLVLVSLIFFSSCLFYKTVPIDEITPTTVEALSKQKQYVTLQSNGATGTYIVEDLKVENGILTGNLKKPTVEIPPMDRRIFRSSVNKKAKSFLHLHTSSSIAEGPIEVAINSITAMETHENEIGTSILATTGIFTVVGVAGVAAFLVIACSCPHVATINPDGSSEFQGSLFPGSIFKSLERKDFLVLNKIRPDSDDLIAVQVYNDLDEVQYIDEIELLAIQHNRSHLGLNKNAELVSFNIGELPIKAFSQIESDVLSQIVSRDEEEYKFDEPALGQSLNNITLTFNTNNLKEDALLIIRGQQTELLEQTAEFFFQQFGTEFNAWVEKMNNKEASNYNQNSVEQGISLNAYIKSNDKWVYLDSYENVGAMAKRDIAIPIKIKDVDDEIEIKLEAAYGFWSIDQVTLTSDWSNELTIQSLDLISAINQDNEDVLDRLAATDDNYLTQSLKGTSTNLKFKAPSIPKLTYVLSGSGYYNHVRNYSAAPNYRFLKKMNRTKLSTHELAQMVQLYMDIQLASNN